MFENRVEENNRKEENGIWRKLHMRSLMICSDSLNIVIKSRKLRRIGHVAYMREIRNACRPLSGS
jgi:hypothetical protein